MKDLSTDLPSCCHLHNGSRAIMSSGPQMGFCAYIVSVQIGVMNWEQSEHAWE